MVLNPHHKCDWKTIIIMDRKYLQTTLYIIMCVLILNTPVLARVQCPSISRALRAVKQERTNIGIFACEMLS